MIEEIKGYENGIASNFKGYNEAKNPTLKINFLKDIIRNAEGLIREYSEASENEKRERPERYKKMLNDENVRAALYKFCKKDYE